ncbi:hypothetical protein [Bulleidia sp. zg-1006]|uniref:hypothetical protein n=1 Tax=Bulleidia sp. zg-1006 TaxID=2806552 RepID=UPI00193A9C3A|nr:hypothetical protein [Bulleidia sp. zg-1006]QRG86051.1 hypothetical protein JOS54_04040 [Bulleidia sp. zg-1006]
MNKNKVMIRVSIVIILLGIIGMMAFVFFKGSNIQQANVQQDIFTIDLTKNLEYKVTGWNGKGYIKVLSNKINPTKNKKIEEFEKTLKYVTKDNYKLKIGDTTTLSVHYDKKVAEKAGITVSNDKKEIHVDDLVGKKVENKWVKTDYGNGKYILEKVQYVDGVEIPEVWRDRPDKIVQYLEFVECEKKHPETYHSACPFMEN